MHQPVRFARRSCPALALLLALPAAADRFDGLPSLCRSLRADGWGLTSHTAKYAPDTQVEIDLPGILYLCTVWRELPPQARGHAPELGALISKTDDDASVILSASWYCDADAAPTLAALAAVVADTSDALDIPLPDGFGDAIIGARSFEAIRVDARFAVTPIDGDPDACRRVPPDGVGAVRAKVDVTIEGPG